MNEATTFVTVISKVTVTAEDYTRTIELGDEVNGVEIYGINVTRNTNEFFNLEAWDENENLIFKLNIIKPRTNEIHMMKIAIDGPAETK